MFNISKKIIIDTLVSILRILRTREPWIQPFCNFRSIQRLRNLPIDQMIQKCVFILGSCSLRNISLLYRRGIFREKFFLQMIGELLTLRRVDDVQIVSDLMREFKGFEGLFFRNRFFLSAMFFHFLFLLFSSPNNEY